MDLEQARRHYINQLESVIKQMIQPLKDVPFNLVIEAMTGHRVESFEIGNSFHQKCLDILILAGRKAAEKINENGILSRRANEVGNLVEPFVKNAINSIPGAVANTPATPSGRRKSSGYPDIEVSADGRIFYLECKTYNIKNISTTQRSFYFSPSDEFKVREDALHFVLSYEIFTARAGLYKTAGFKLLSINNLSLDLKHEFNSDNRRLYSGQHGALILHEESIAA